MLRMSTQDCARTVDMVQAGRGLREICISWLYWLFLIKIFILTLSKINKANSKKLQLL